MDINFNQPFGQWLRQRRKVAHLTQQQLAEQAGCATISIRRIEAGTLRASTQLAEQLASVLDIPLAEQASFIKYARHIQSESNPPTETQSPEGTSPPIPPNGNDQEGTKMWRQTEYMLALLPLFFAIIVLIVNPRYLGTLAVMEPPFLIVNVLPCGWFVFLVVLGLMMASKYTLQHGRSQNRSTLYRTGINGVVLLCMTFPALLLILLAPALFQAMRAGGFPS
ncbi:MAG: helix-turn-helix transcriptional regulator [Chloroflexota bacterium]